jgi:hypothetical protein
MAKLVFGMNVSLDGYVDHMRFQPDPTLFRHFIDEAEGQAGSIYGRNMYEIMRYWDEDHADVRAAAYPALPPPMMQTSNAPEVIAGKTTVFGRRERAKPGVSASDSRSTPRGLPGGAYGSRRIGGRANRRTAILSQNH